MLIETRPQVTLGASLYPVRAASFGGAGAGDKLLQKWTHLWLHLSVFLLKACNYKEL